MTSFQDFRDSFLREAKETWEAAQNKEPIKPGPYHIHTLKNGVAYIGTPLGENVIGVLFANAFFAVWFMAEKNWPLPRKGTA